MIDQPGKQVGSIDAHANYGHSKQWDLEEWDPYLRPVTIEAEYRFTGLSPSLAKARCKIGVAGLAWLVGGYGFGCRKPSARYPAFSLRHVLTRKRGGWSPPKPVRDPKETWREWRLRVADWKAIRQREWLYLILPYAYLRNAWAQTKRCGWKHVDKGLWVENGEWHRHRTTVHWSSGGKANGKIVVKIDGRPSVYWKGLKMEKKRDSIHVHKGDVELWDNLWADGSQSQAVTVERRNLKVW